MATEGAAGQITVMPGVAAIARPRRSPIARLFLLARRKPLGAISAMVIALTVLTAVFAPLLAPYNPTTTHPRDKLQGPSAKYKLGTDDLGRDVLSRIIVGARTSLIAGVAATLCGTMLGGLVGMVSGYAGGGTDLVIQRVMDSIQALPLIVLLLVVVVALGPSMWNIIWAISIGIFPAACRIVRSATLAVKTEPFVEAARVVGARPARIVFAHVFPNVTAPLIVVASVTIGAAILAEASLSFLGLGVPPPNPSWGGMLAASGRRYFEREPTLAIFPGLAISITVLAFNLLGDTLRDILDPRLRGR